MKQKEFAAGRFPDIRRQALDQSIKKEEASIDMWLKDIAPSDKLRKWFGHDHGKWDEFKERYFKELDGKKESVELILQKLRSDTPGVAVLWSQGRGIQ